MLAAVFEDGPNGCNQGFLRDDAPLIVVYVASLVAGDYPPEFWANTLFDAKGGGSDAVGVIGIVSDHMIEDPICLPASNDPSPTIEFLRDYMPQHVLGSICGEDLTPYFDQGIEMTRELCQQYVPQ